MIHNVLLLDLIKNKAKNLIKLPGNLDPVKLLISIAINESSFGFNRIPRYEKSYGVFSAAYKRSELLGLGHKKWGDLAAMSYGSFQVLWITAAELGYTGSPIDLWLPGDIDCIDYAIKLLNIRIIPKSINLSDIADGYNSGNPKDGIIPLDYINKTIKNYEIAGQMLI